MSVHLTVNGVPLCQHTACQAGREDAAKVTAASSPRLPQVLCGHATQSAGLSVANRWARVHPSHTVALVLGICPEVQRLIDEAGPSDDVETYDAPPP